MNSESIKKLLQNEMVATTVAHAIKKGNTVEIKRERDKIVFVEIDRKAKAKIEIKD